ncbi:hypothetical protein LX36DRAFT_655178 [Colletotrichum falcatum]|nr:hypothetical protein LX36DRAFT_655178 [Colletotrichum falcatum]
MSTTPDGGPAWRCAVLSCSLFMRSPELVCASIPRSPRDHDTHLPECRREPMGLQRQRQRLSCSLAEDAQREREVMRERGASWTPRRESLAAKGCVWTPRRDANRSFVRSRRRQRSA